MAIETKQLHALSKIYNECVYGKTVNEGDYHSGTGEKVASRTKKFMDKKGQKGAPGLDAMKARTAEHKARRGVKNEDAQYGYDKKGNSLNPVDIEKKKRKDDDLAGAPGKKAKKDYDGDGKIESGKAEYFGSKDKAIKKAMGKKEVKEGDTYAKQLARFEANRRKREKQTQTYERPNYIPKDQDHSDDYGSSKGKKVKKESFSDWRYDLKEIPDYEQIPVDAKKRNAKVEEKNVKNTIKINPEMKEEATVISEKEIEEGVYEKQKTKEVMGALKKRDLKKDVKAKIAADIVKKKGDTSKSDDRYAYESKLWDEVAAHLTELGELNDADFKVEGYQRNPEKGEEESRKAKRERKGGYDEKREKRMSSPTRGIDSPAFKEFMRSRGM